jgi:hypothetical protein
LNTLYIKIRVFMGVSGVQQECIMRDAIKLSVTHRICVDKLRFVCEISHMTRV